MATNPTAAGGFADPVPLASISPINTGLSSAREQTMIEMLGSPAMPLTTQGQSDRASPVVKRLLVTEAVSANIRARGIKPAVDSLRAVLAQAFLAAPGLEAVLATEGMLSVRMRKPTDGSVSKEISNHAWGTAIDFKLAGGTAPGNTGGNIPRYIAVLVPLFNKAGWFSGIAFRDTMHFEVADQTVRTWASEGKFEA